MGINKFPKWRQLIYQEDLTTLKLHEPNNSQTITDFWRKKNNIKTIVTVKLLSIKKTVKQSKIMIEWCNISAMHSTKKNYYPENTKDFKQHE